MKGLLSEIPFVRLRDIASEAQLDRWMRADFVLNVEAGRGEHRLICEVKNHGQPRVARAAAAQLKLYCDQLGPSAYGVLIAPYISEASRKICREYGVGFADLAGNCRLVFDHIFIERTAGAKPVAEQRELRSVFAPKSAQVLRVLLREPSRGWKVTELAEAADVSLGHVSNVRGALIEREWAAAGSDGLHLTNPNALLDSWREVYRRTLGTRHTFYTALHGHRLEETVRQMMAHRHPPTKVILGSFSAAQWLAPYARTSTEYFYANAHGVDALKSSLELTSAAKGENVVVMEVEDEGFFRDAVEPAPGILATSPVQTYLDLSVAGSRGREAADHLRRERLQWQ